MQYKLKIISKKITLCNSAYCYFKFLMKHHKASAIKKSNLIEIALLINLYITVYRRIKLLLL